MKLGSLWSLYKEHQRSFYKDHVNHDNSKLFPTRQHTKTREVFSSCVTNQDRWHWRLAAGRRILHNRKTQVLWTCIRNAETIVYRRLWILPVTRNVSTKTLTLDLHRLMFGSMNQLIGWYNDIIKPVEGNSMQSGSSKFFYQDLTVTKPDPKSPSLFQFAASVAQFFISLLFTN